MLGYKFNTEQEAINARVLLDSHVGFSPINGNVTQHYFGYSYSINDGFWFITYTNEMGNVLGTPIEFSITEVNKDL